MSINGWYSKQKYTSESIDIYERESCNAVVDAWQTIAVNWFMLSND